MAVIDGAFGNCNEAIDLCTKSGNEDEKTTADVSKSKTKEMKNEGTVGLHNDSQKLQDKCNPGTSKSNANVSVPNVNDNDKVQTISTDTGKTLNKINDETTTLHKQKNIAKPTSGPKSELAVYPKHLPILRRMNFKYPPPYPLIPRHNSQPGWKKVPPIPRLKIDVKVNTVKLTWELNLSSLIAKIVKYEVFVCQETDTKPNISMWKKKDTVEDRGLPMEYEIQISELGYVYHFAVRAVDEHERRGPAIVQNAKV